MRTRTYAPLAGLATLLAATIVVLSDAGEPWQPLFALLFLALGPGLCLVPLIGLDDPQAELVLVLPVSLMVGMLTSAALFYSGTWSSDRELALLAAICLAGVAAQLSERRRPARSAA
jgi:hypothetical protein